MAVRQQNRQKNEKGLDHTMIVSSGHGSRHTSEAAKILGGQWRRAKSWKKNYCTYYSVIHNPWKFIMYEEMHFGIFEWAVSLVDSNNFTSECDQRPLEL